MCILYIYMYNSFIFYWYHLQLFCLGPWLCQIATRSALLSLLEVASWVSWISSNPVTWCIPSGYVKIAVDNGPVEIVDLPSYKMVIFHSYVNVYQRVTNRSAPRCPGPLRTLRLGPQGQQFPWRARRAGLVAWCGKWGAVVRKRFTWPTCVEDHLGWFCRKN